MKKTIKRKEDKERGKEWYILEGTRDMPHVGIEPGENIEDSGSCPNCDEPFGLRMGHSRVTTIRVAEVLLHFFPSFLSLSRFPVPTQLSTLFSYPLLRLVQNPFTTSFLYLLILWWPIRASHSDNKTSIDI